MRTCGEVCQSRSFTYSFLQITFIQTFIFTDIKYILRNLISQEFLKLIVRINLFKAKYLNVCRFRKNLCILDICYIYMLSHVINKIFKWFLYRSKVLKILMFNFFLIHHIPITNDFLFLNFLSKFMMQQAFFQFLFGLPRLYTIKLAELTLNLALLLFSFFI